MLIKKYFKLLILKIKAAVALLLSFINNEFMHYVDNKYKTVKKNVY